MIATPVSVSVPAATSVVYNPSVSRSAELVSCARTALKIAQNRHAKGGGGLANNANATDWLWNANPADLELYNPQDGESSSFQSPEVETAQDGLTLLRSMESNLSHLQELVRRRGHSNDPTEEIGRTVQRLEQDAKELAAVIATLAPTRSSSGSGSGSMGMQRRRHWEAVQQWFQHAAQQRATRLKQILAVRGMVLQEQAERRRRFQTTTSGNQNQQQLFSLPPPLPPVMKQKLTGSQQPTYPLAQPPTPTTTALATSTNNTAYASYPNTTSVAGQAANQTPSAAPLASTRYNYGSRTSASVGYGGTANRSANASLYAGPSHSATTGMRQRRAGGNNDNTSSNNNSEYHYQQQQQLLQERLQERQTARRRQEAQQAEKSLAELGTVFGKMATLIHQQSDVLETIEDDVEAAAFDVRAGHTEITTLYSLKKGNRALILKVFGLLIFFIVFMRLYVRK